MNIHAGHLHQQFNMIYTVLGAETRADILIIYIDWGMGDWKFN